MNLHYSLFQFVDTLDVHHIIDLSKIQTIEHCPDDFEFSCKLQGLPPIELNQQEGDRLLEAWNQYKQISHAIQISAKWDGDVTAKKIKSCLDIDRWFFVVANSKLNSELNDKSDCIESAS